MGLLILRSINFYDIFKLIQLKYCIIFTLLINLITIMNLKTELLILCLLTIVNCSQHLKMVKNLNNL